MALTSDHQDKILILEPNQGFVHIGGLKGEFPKGPPWQADGWESVYVGDHGTLDNWESLIDIYPVGPYLSVYYRIASSPSTLHRAVPYVRTPLELALVERLCKEKSQFTGTVGACRMNLTARMREISFLVAERISDTLPEISNPTRARIAEIVGHRSNALGSLFPVLLDDEVEETYIDGPQSSMYFDHRRLGRCSSMITLGQQDAERIVTLVRCESNLHLDRHNPSLKTDVNLFDANLRFSVCLPPLSVDGLHLEIRRAPSNPYSIYDLIRNGTLTIEAAALLLLAVCGRFNITITGGPGSGKTTLLNSLDMTTPRAWRKIYVEDAIESRRFGDQHQVRYRVDPLDETEAKFDKSTEIIKTLHRSPDYLILGEIQTAEHSRALFQAIAAGLRSIQTCHSDSASSLVSRWMLNHGIDRSSIALMDVIVTVERLTPGESKRRVKEIAEIRRTVNDGMLSFAGLNRVFANGTILPEKSRWAKDGAFILRAQEQGADSHLAAYEALIDRLVGSSDSYGATDTSPIGERLWKSGNPFMHTEQE